MDDQIRIKATTTADLLTHLHFSLGYIPLDSLVIVGMLGRIAGPVLRVDYPDDPDTFMQVSANEYLRNTGVTDVIVVVYDRATSARQAWESAKRHLNWPVYTAVSLDADGYTDLPTGKHHALAELESCNVAASMVAQGFPLPKRGLSVEIPDPEFASDETDVLIWNNARLNRAVDDRDDWVALEPYRREFEAALMADGGPAEPAPLIAAFLNPYLRDRFMADVVMGPDSRDPEAGGKALMGKVAKLDQERMAHFEYLLGYLLRWVRDPEYRAPLLTVMSWAKWMQGQSSAAGVYVDAARKADPKYALARLLDTLYGVGYLPRHLTNRNL